MMHKRMWELKQSASPGTLDLYIYGDVESDDPGGWLSDPKESETSANALRDALAQQPNAQQINLYINSYGGSVFEGTAIYNQLRRHPAHKTAYIDGFACSIASVIAMAADEIVMPRNAMMMIHNMWMGAVGNADELRKAAEDLDKINAAGREAYLAKAGDKLSPDQLVEMQNRETWLTAEECMQYGLADRYADKDADMSQAAEILKTANGQLAQQLAARVSLSAQMRALQEPQPAPHPPDPKEKTINPILKLFERSM